MDISNQGLELNLSASILKNTPLKWDLSFNASYNKNKLEKLPENQKTTVIGDHKLQVGQSVDAFGCIKIKAFIQTTQKFLL